MEEFELPTPEAVSIRFDIAGIGSRFLAVIVDSLVQTGIAIVIIIGAVAFGLSGSAGLSAGIIILVTAEFLLIWGYFVAFETLWRGQTPGKRAMKLRVIKTDGYPITFLDAFIRNLVRLVDFLPGGYGIGVITMFISPQSRRLGDYAAGTIVVKERAAVSIHELETTAARGRIPPGGAPARGTLDPDELQWDLSVLTAQDLEVMSAYLDRAASLRPDVRQRIGGEIAERVAEKVGARQPFDSVRFVERVLYLRDEEQRAPQAPRF